MPPASAAAPAASLEAQVLLGPEPRTFGRQEELPEGEDEQHDELDDEKREQLEREEEEKQMRELREARLQKSRGMLANIVQMRNAPGTRAAYKPYQTLWAVRGGVDEAVWCLLGFVIANSSRDRRRTTPTGGASMATS